MLGSWDVLLFRYWVALISRDITAPCTTDLLYVRSHSATVSNFSSGAAHRVCDVVELSAFLSGQFAVQLLRLLSPFDYLPLVIFIVLWTDLFYCRIF